MVAFQTNLARIKELDNVWSLDQVVLVVDEETVSIRHRDTHKVRLAHQDVSGLSVTSCHVS
jgi:hypothetical protein